MRQPHVDPSDAVQVLGPAGVVDVLGAAGVGPGVLLAMVVVPRLGVGLAAGAERWLVAADPAQVVTDVSAALAPRWVWWDAGSAARPLLGSGVRIRTCWDLAAVHRVLYGGRRDDPAAVWAGCHSLDDPAPPRREVTLLDFDVAQLEGSEFSGPVRPDGHLNPDWAERDWAERDWAERDWAERSRGTREWPDRQLALASEWAGLAVDVQVRQERALRALPDPRADLGPLPLAVVTAYAESAAALLSVELEHDGMPLDRGAAEEFIAGFIGPRPASADDEAIARIGRDAAVLQHFPVGVTCDLRNPAQVRDLLRRVGIDYPDTRSWRLEPFRASHPGVAAFLDWRKAERIATTYGYGWLDRHVGADGRLRGAWGAADAAAGRMTAQAGLHNLPAGLRVAVAAEPGHLLVRADLGQIEPRVLAAVSGDPALTEATRADDLYAPVAEQLHCDRPTAKVAVLAAMYGQTSGAAGEALVRMERSYPMAIGYLRGAEQAGIDGRDTRTFGGRLIKLRRAEASVDDLSPELAAIDVPPGPRPVPTGHGRFARNAVIQGAAAELFKAWAASVRTALLPIAGRIVLCLHDELLVHVPRDRADEAADLLVRTLGSTTAIWAAGSGVRFVADVVVVRCWSDAKG